MSLEVRVRCVVAFLLPYQNDYLMKYFHLPADILVEKNIMPIHALKPFDICKLQARLKPGKASDIKLAADIKAFKGTDLISQFKALPKILKVSPLGSLFIIGGSFLALSGINEAPTDTVFGASLSTLGIGAMYEGKWMIDLHIGAYIKATNFIKRNGYDRDKARPYFLTACGRNIIKLAAKENGCLKEYMDQYCEENIKWYHGIIPKPWKTKKPPDFMGYL